MPVYPGLLRAKPQCFVFEISSGDVTLSVCLIMEPVKELHGLMRSCDQRLYKIPSQSTIWH